MSEKGLRRPLIVPIFIPGQGCPHRCIFCNQESFTSQASMPVDASHVRKVLDTAIRSPAFDPARDPEVAFYGGTFTMLPPAKIALLLGAVRPYLEKGYFKSIRVSTRPDAIDEERLSLIRNFGVSTVEVGAQSMDEEVLRLSRRGHTSRDISSSVQMLRQYGMRVGIQLLPGLPGDTEEKLLWTVDEVIKLGPDMVRIYPALVIRGTELAKWYEEGRYRPLGLEEAVKICAEASRRLEGAGIPVIRIGVMSSPFLAREGEILAGPWHEAFGFLVRSALYREKIEPHLPGPGYGERLRIMVPRREVPLARGYKNSGLRWIQERTGARDVQVLADDLLGPGRVKVERA